MTPAKCASLEKDIKFKRFFVPKDVWFKNFIYLLAPIILLAFSAFSIKYIFDAGKLASLMTIPYVIVFMFSIVLLKLSRNFIVKREVSRDGAYLVCLAKAIKEDDKDVYVIFSIGEHRHEKYYLEKHAKQVSEDIIPILNHKSKACLLNTEEELYVKVFRKSKMIEKRIEFADNNIFPLEYVNDAHVALIPYKLIRE